MIKRAATVMLAAISITASAKPVDLSNVDIFQACSEINSTLTTTIESLELLKFNLDREIKNTPLDVFREKYNLLLSKPLLENIKKNIRNTNSCRNLIVSAFIPVHDECIYEYTKGEWLVKEKYICPNEYIGKLGGYAIGETYTVELIKDVDGPNKSLMSVSFSVFDDILEKASTEY